MDIEQKSQREQRSRQSQESAERRRLQDLREQEFQRDSEFKQNEEDENRPFIPPPQLNIDQSMLRGARHFNELRNDLNEEEVQNIKRDMYTDLFFDALILVLIFHFGSKGTCGIPIFKWNIVYFAVLGLRSISNLLKIFIVRNHYAYANKFSLVSFILIDGFFLGWLVYGNILFYSTENNCNLIEQTQVLYNMMLILIVIGYFQMLVYGLILFCLPCILYAVRTQMQRNEGRGELSSQAIPQVIQSLARMKFNPEQFTHENQCVICYTEYKPDDEVTPLDCDTRHYFHTKCIEDWIKNGHNTCPVCRKPINNLQGIQ